MREGRSEWEEKQVKLSHDWYRSHLFIGDLTIKVAGMVGNHAKDNSDQHSGQLLNFIGLGNDAVWREYSWSLSDGNNFTGIYLSLGKMLKLLEGNGRIESKLLIWWESEQLRTGGKHPNMMRTWLENAAVTKYSAFPYHVMPCQHNCYRIPSLEDGYFKILLVSKSLSLIKPNCS